MHTIARAVCFQTRPMTPEFKIYTQAVLDNAQALASELQAGGLKLITGGTSNHLILADVYSSFGIDGKEAQERLEAVGITLNANSIPDDELPPYRPSGIRLGTPAMTTAGMGVDDMRAIAQRIISTLKA